MCVSNKFHKKVVLVYLGNIRRAKFVKKRIGGGKVVHPKEAHLNAQDVPSTHEDIIAARIQDY